MRKGSGVAGDLLLAGVLVVVGLFLELVGAHAVGFGLIFGGWAALLVHIVRTSRGARQKN